jgi:hypothetical protein
MLVGSSVGQSVSRLVIICSSGIFGLMGRHLSYVVCVHVTVTMVMLLRDFGPHKVIFMMCVFSTLNFPAVLGGSLLAVYTRNFSFVMYIPRICNIKC